MNHTSAILFIFSIQKLQILLQGGKFAAMK